MSQHDALEEAWAAAEAVLDDEQADAESRAVLLTAERLLAARGDDPESRVRRARVLAGLAAVGQEADDPQAVQEVVEPLLEGRWPDEALEWRLSGAAAAAVTTAIPLRTRIPIAGRAIALAPGTDDAWCRELVVWLLLWLADAVGIDSPERRAALLTRVVEEFEDVDDAADRARAALADPYHRGVALAQQPGQGAAAADAFRRAAEAGVPEAWLELAVVLALQPSREDEEEQALREAVERDSPERSTYASWRLGMLRFHLHGDREGAREAYGRATTATGPHALSAVRELAALAALDGDERARAALVTEYAQRTFAAEFGEAMGPRTVRFLVAATRVGFARPVIALGSWRWRRRRKRAQG